MGKKSKNRKPLRYVDFKETPGFPAFLVFLSILAVAICNLINLIIGQFRTFYIWIAPPLAFLRITTTLWRIEAYSQCLGLFAIQRRVCRHVVGYLNNMSIEDYSAATCAHEGMLLQTLNLGCFESLSLRLGSILLAVSFALGILFQVMAAVTAVIWWLNHRRLYSRKGIIIMLSLSPIFELCGLICYLYLVGFMMVNSHSHTISQAFGENQQQLPNSDINGGMFVAVGCLALSAILPFAAASGFRKDCCIDWDEDYEEEETHDLIKEYERYMAAHPF